MTQTAEKKRSTVSRKRTANRSSSSGEEKDKVSDASASDSVGSHIPLSLLETLDPALARQMQEQSANTSSLSPLRRVFPRQAVRNCASCSFILTAHPLYTVGTVCILRSVSTFYIHDL